jgi:hypothetical protein
MGSTQFVWRGNSAVQVDCDCGGNPSLLSSEELSFQNAAEISARVERLLAERFEWKLHSHSHPHANPRGTVEVQLFVTEDTFVAGLSVYGSGSHIDHPMPPISETVAMTAAEAQSQSPISAVQELAELHADDKSQKSDVSVESSADSSCDSSGKPVDKQEEGKRRRAKEKRRKELEKRQKDSEKKQAEKVRLSDLFPDSPLRGVAKRHQPVYVFEKCRASNACNWGWIYSEGGDGVKHRQNEIK